MSLARGPTSFPTCPSVAGPYFRCSSDCLPKLSIGSQKIFISHNGAPLKTPHNSNHKNYRNFSLFPHENASWRPSLTLLVRGAPFWRLRLFSTITFTVICKFRLFLVFFSIFLTITVDMMAKCSIFASAILTCWLGETKSLQLLGMFHLR